MLLLPEWPWKITPIDIQAESKQQNSNDWDQVAAANSVVSGSDILSSDTHLYFDAS